MLKKTKKKYDRKEAVQLRLMERSSKDPLYSDPSANPNIYIPYENSNESKNKDYLKKKEEILSHFGVLPLQEEEKDNIDPVEQVFKRQEALEKHIREGKEIKFATELEIEEIKQNLKHHKEDVAQIEEEGYYEDEYENEDEYEDYEDDYGDLDDEQYADAGEEEKEKSDISNPGLKMKEEMKESCCSAEGKDSIQEWKDNIEKSSNLEEQITQFQQIENEINKQIFNFKPNSGVKMLQYDQYGMPIDGTDYSKYLAKDDALPSDVVIKPPSSYVPQNLYDTDKHPTAMTAEEREVHACLQNSETDSENELEDDFVDLANEGIPAVVLQSQDDQTAFGFKKVRFEDIYQEEKSKQENEDKFKLFSNNSIPCNEDRKEREIDKAFNCLMDEYRDDEIGETLDGAEIDDRIDNKQFEGIMDEFLMEHSKKKVKNANVQTTEEESKAEQQELTEETKIPVEIEIENTFENERNKTKSDKSENEEQDENDLEEKQAIKEQILKLEEKEIEEGEATEETLEAYMERIAKKKEEKWDIETIVTTYTNTDNHPNLIKEHIPKPSRRFKKKEKKIQEKKEQEEEEKKNDVDNEDIEDEDDGDGENGEQSEQSKQSEEEEILNVRKKGETKEQRKLRKKLIKEQRQLKRKQKKLLKNAFNKESCKAAKIQLGGNGIKPGLSIRNIL